MTEFCRKFVDLKNSTHSTVLLKVYILNVDRNDQFEGSLDSYRKKPPTCIVAAVTPTKTFFGGRFALLESTSNEQSVQKLFKPVVFVCKFSIGI